MAEVDIDIHERVTRLETTLYEHLKAEEKDISEIKESIKSLHDDILSIIVARKAVVKLAAFITMLGGFGMAVWKFIISGGHG